MSGTNSITGARTPEPAQGTFESIVVIQTPEPELQAPDPDEMFSPHPADGLDPPPSNSLAGVLPETPVTNNNPPGGVEPPDAGAPLPPDPLQTGLGSKVDEIANRSPTLKDLIDKARSEGWHIQVSTDRRSQADDRSIPKTIHINPNEIGPGGDWNAKLTALLSHEVGHAATPYPELAQGRTKDEYVQKNVELALHHEGVAAFTNAKVRDEIKSDGGPDTEIRGKHDAQYIAIYDEYKNGRITEDEAIRRMSEVQGTEPEEFLDDGSSLDRRAILEETYGARWDETHPQ